MAAPAQPFVSRAGLKLAHGLDAFAVDVTGLRCADFGCNIGGFTDCLLQRGAASVISIDTGYGTLAWKLRQDPRVVVRERTNALHAESPAEGVDLVTIDLAWTPQRLSLPAARRWLAPGGRVLTLVKPHYEVTDVERPQLVQGVLPHEVARRVADRVVAETERDGWRVAGRTESPITGGKSTRGGSAGNLEILLLLDRAQA